MILICRQAFTRLAMEIAKKNNFPRDMAYSSTIALRVNTSSKKGPIHPPIPIFLLRLRTYRNIQLALRPAHLFSPMVGYHPKERNEKSGRHLVQPRMLKHGELSRFPVSRIPPILPVLVIRIAAKPIAKYLRLQPGLPSSTNQACVLTAIHMQRKCGLHQMVLYASCLISPNPVLNPSITTSQIHLISSKVGTG